MREAGAERISALRAPLLVLLVSTSPDSIPILPAMRWSGLVAYLAASTDVARSAID
jgi:hypothetical protein